MMGFSGCRGLFSMGFMGGGMWLYTIAFVLIVIAAVYLISNNNHGHHNSKNSALEILNQEYSKGNVSDDDYKKRKDNLKG